MYNNSDEQFIIMQSTIKSKKQYMKANNQYSDKKMNNLKKVFKEILS